MTTELVGVVDVPCGPLDDPHPRYRGLRTAGRLAAYEATAVGVVFAGWVLVDTALTRLAALRGVVRRTLPTPTTRK